MANSFKVYVAVDDSGGTIRDISQFVTQSSWPRTVDMLDSHGVADVSKESTAGLKDGDVIQLEIIWDNTATTGFVAVFGGDSIGDTRSVEYGPNGSTGGEEKISAEAIIQTVDRGHSRGELVTATVSLQVTGTVTEGTF